MAVADEEPETEETTAEDSAYDEEPIFGEEPETEETTSGEASADEEAPAEDEERIFMVFAREQ